MQHKYIIYIFLFFFVSVYAADKKEKTPKQTPVKTLLKDARQAIKNSKDQKNKEKTLQEALKREGLSNSDKADIYNMMINLENSINDGENLKAYLKQKYDTVSYFSTMYNAIQYAIICDSIDKLPDEKGKVKPRYASKNRDVVLLYRPSIYLGGRFYLRKADYAKTYDYMSMYTEFHRLPSLHNHPKLQNDTLLQHSTYYAAMSAYYIKQPSNSLKYIDQAIQYADTLKAPVLLEYKVRCMQELNRNDEWLNLLIQGVRQYPKHDYFYLTLSKHYENSNQYDTCIALADSMLQHVQDTTLYWYTKSLMYLLQEKWIPCAEMAEIVLDREPDHVNALYNQAVSYVNAALDFALTASNDVRKAQYKKDKQRLNDLYMKAKAPSESLRRLRPNNINTWAPLLYRIYLNLNMGAEFSEIEQLIKESQKQ